MSTQGLESWDATWLYVQSLSRPSKKTRALFQKEKCYHWQRLLFCCKILRVWAIITIVGPSRGSLKHLLFMIGSVRSILSACSWDLVFSRFPLQSELSYSHNFSLDSTRKCIALMSYLMCVGAWSPMWFILPLKYEKKQDNCCHFLRVTQCQALLILE